MENNLILTDIKLEPKVKPRPPGLHHCSSAGLRDSMFNRAAFWHYFAVSFATTIVSDNPLIQPHFGNI